MCNWNCLRPCSLVHRLLISSQIMATFVLINICCQNTDNSTEQLLKRGPTVAMTMRLFGELESKLWTSYASLVHQKLSEAVVHCVVHYVVPSLVLWVQPLHRWSYTLPTFIRNDRWISTLGPRYRLKLMARKSIESKGLNWWTLDSCRLYQNNNVELTVL